MHGNVNRKKVCMAIFCTASHWNTEAILLAADRFARKYEIDRIPIAVAMTLNYRNMPQVRRVTYQVIQKQVSKHNGTYEGIVRLRRNSISSRNCTSAS